jgi:hypothetical protein
MYLTQPPCKALGVYLENHTSEHLQRLVKIQHETGITVGRFFSALEPHCREVLKDWEREAEKMTRKIWRSNWTAFMYAEQRSRFWECHGRPRIVMSLESTRGDEMPIAKAAYAYSVASEDECESGWT